MSCAILAGAGMISFKGTPPHPGRGRGIGWLGKAVCGRVNSSLCPLAWAAIPTTALAVGPTWQTWLLEQVALPPMAFGISLGSFR